MKAFEATTTDDYLISVITKIRASDLEETLLLLPFSAVCELLEKLTKLSDQRKDQTELVCKIVMFLFRIHHKPIVNNQVLLPSIQKLIKNLETSIGELRDMVGSNFHSMTLLQRRIEQTDSVELFKDATRARKMKDRKHKKRQIAKRAHLQLNA